LGNPFICRNVSDERLPRVSDGRDCIVRPVDQELVRDWVEWTDDAPPLLRNQAIRDLNSDASTDKGQDQRQLCTTLGMTRFSSCGSWSSQLSFALSCRMSNSGAG
jgi:hypothetical protein